MKFLKKTALLIVCLLSITLFTGTFHAATVAKIGSRSYSSLKKAVDDVRNGQTIKLKRNTSVRSAFDINNGRKFTIDLQRHKIIVSTYSGIAISNAGVTVKNGTVASGKNYDTIFSVSKKGNLKIKSGTYTGSIEVGNFSSNKGKLVIDRGTFKGKKGKWILYNYGTATINGGTFQAAKSAQTYNQYGVIQNHHNCIVKGGTFTGYQPGEIILTTATSNVKGNTAALKISGGTFNALKRGDNSWPLFGFLEAYDTKITISGGTIKGGMLINDGCQIMMTGGSIKYEDPITFDGTDSTFTLKGGSITAILNKSIDLATAVAVNAGNGGKIKISGGTVRGGVSYNDTSRNMRISYPVIYASPSRVTIGSNAKIINNGEYLDISSEKEMVSLSTVNNE